MTEQSTVVNEFGAELCVSQLDEESFTAAGRRDWVKYRDLGVGAATKGNVSANISSVTKGGQISTGWHYHTCSVQIFYIMKGWLEVDLYGLGVTRLEEGACVTMPPGQLHNELRSSVELEVLEIVVPGELGTVAVGAPPERS